jgi:hypothetical protein
VLFAIIAERSAADASAAIEALAARRYEPGLPERVRAAAAQSSAAAALAPVVARVLAG